MVSVQLCRSQDFRSANVRSRRPGAFTPRTFGRRPRRPPDERSCGRDGPVTYRSSPERVCPRAVVPKGRADRDRNGQTTPHARAPAGGRRDAGWPGVSAAPLRARCGRSAAILYYPLPSGVRRVTVYSERQRGGEKRQAGMHQTNYKGARAHAHAHTPATLTHKNSANTHKQNTSMQRRTRAP